MLHDLTSHHTLNLILQQMSLFWAGRVWTANSRFEALFNEQFNILLQTQTAKYALALGDGGHLFQRKLSQAQFTGQERCQVHVPTGFVARAAHGMQIWDA